LGGGNVGVVRVPPRGNDRGQGGTRGNRGMATRGGCVPNTEDEEGKGGTESQNPKTMAERVRGRGGGR